MDTDCRLPAGKPSCWIWLTCTLPLASAYCVRPPEEKFTTGLPSETPLMVAPVNVTDATGGLGWPLAPKVKLVPTFRHATAAPVALGST